MKKIYFLFILLILNFYTKAQTIVSAQAGNWNSPTTWVGGVVPNATNCIAVNVNHPIIITSNLSMNVSVVVTNAALTVDEDVNFNYDGSASFASNSFYFFNSTFTNKGNVYIYGILKLTVTTFIQNTPKASLIFHLSDGTSQGSIPVLHAGFEADNSNLVDVNNGLIQFLEPTFNYPTSTIQLQSCTNNRFGDENSNLVVKFGGTNNTIYNATADGFNLSLYDNVAFFARKILLDNGSNAPQILNLNGNQDESIVTDTLQIENGEVRASGEYSLVTNYRYLKNVGASRIINKGIFNITNLYWQPKTNNTQTLFVESGIWRNKVVSSTLIMDKLTVGNQYPQPHLRIGIPNFHCNTLYLYDNLFLDNDTIIVDDFYVAAQQGKIIHTNGIGKLKLKIPGNFNFNYPGFFIPLGTNRGEALLGIVRDATVTTEPDDYFYFSCKPTTNALNINQSLPVEWTVEELTPGGNEKLHFFANVRDTGFNAEHAIFLSKPYKKTGTTWNEITSVPYRFKKGYYYSEYYAFYPIFYDTTYNAIRGTFSFASGRGLSATALYQATTKTSGTNNWSLPTTWVDNIVPTANDIIFVKNTDSVYIDVNVNCKSGQTSGALKIPQNKTLTVGNVGGDNGEIFNNGKFIIDTLGTLNLNGRLYSEVTGTFGLKGGTINIDPNSGTEATSVTLTNYKNSSTPFHITGYNDSLWGNINFKDPIYGGYTFDNLLGCTAPYLTIYNNELNKPINFLYGDGVSTNSTNDYFILNSSGLSRTNDNVTFNLQGEIRDTIFEFNKDGLVANNLTVLAGSAYVPVPSFEAYNGNLGFNDNIYGNVTINGKFRGGITFSGSGQQNLQGNGSVSIISGISQYNTNNIPIQINVTDTIRAIDNGTIGFKFGSYILNNSNVEFTGVQSNNNTNFIITNGTGRLIGKIKTVGAPIDGYIFPVGSNDTSYTPITIKPNANHIDDKIGVQVKDSVYRNGINGIKIESNVVNKTWFINEATPGGSNVNLIAEWNANNEMLGFTNISCGISHYVGAWDAFTPTAAIGSGPFSVTRNNINSFSPFAVINSLVSLPVQFISFTGVVNANKKATLSFSVREADVKEYHIQKSTTGFNFTTIKTIPSQGNGTNNYVTIDDEAIQKTAYYKIQQIGTNGSASYSKIIKLDVNNQPEITIQNTIVQNKLTFSIKNAALLSKEFIIVDANGKVVLKNKINSFVNEVKTGLLSTGMYYLIVNGCKAISFLKD
jgi:hypothetical protein